MPYPTGTSCAAATASLLKLFHSAFQFEHEGFEVFGNFLESLVLRFQLLHLVRELLVGLTRHTREVVDLCTRLGGVEVPLGVVDLGAVGPEGILPEGGELRGGRHILVGGRKR